MNIFYSYFMEINRNVIRPKSMIILANGKGVLATKGYDKTKDEHFYRIIGGGMNPGETSEACIRREVQEELGSELEHLNRRDVIENIFRYNGELGHEIVFLFEGQLSDRSLYQKESITIVEPFGEFEAVWVPIEDVLNFRVRLYPVYEYKKIFSQLV